MNYYYLGFANSTVNQQKAFCQSWDQPIHLNRGLQLSEFPLFSPLICHRTPGHQPRSQPLLVHVPESQPGRALSP